MAGQMVEIRWHARGGQGAKTAAMFLAESVLDQGKFGQGFPEYGPERRGAPMRGFTRISETPVRRHCMIEHPGIVTLQGVGTIVATGNLASSSTSTLQGVGSVDQRCVENAGHGQGGSQGPVEIQGLLRLL